MSDVIPFPLSAEALNRITDREIAEVHEREADEMIARLAKTGASFDEIFTAVRKELKS